MGLLEEIEWVDEPTYTSHILGAPVLDVYQIELDGLGTLESKVFGTINVMNGAGKGIYIFRKFKDKPILLKDSNLPLNMPARPVNPVGSLKVEICLTIIRDKPVSLKGTLSLITHSPNEVLHECLDGPNGLSAKVHYILRPHALLANLKFVVPKRDGESCNEVRISGTIEAHAMESKVTLFKGCVDVKYGSSIPLSRKVMVVPAWVHLVVFMQLEFRGTTNEFQESLVVEKEISPSHYQVDYSFGIPSHKDVRIELLPQWFHPHVRSSSSLIYDIVSSNKEESKVRQFLQPVPVLSSNRYSEVLLLEVFSVNIYGYSVNVKPSSLCGSISVTTCMESDIFLFKTDSTSPGKLLHDQSVPLTSRERSIAFLTCGFVKMFIYLKGADGEVWSWGDMNWDDRFFYKSVGWVDRPICSIIKGEDGYAAVYYAIFSAALHAKVTVSLIAKGTSEVKVNVSGCVGAIYTDFKYSADCELQHCRNKLFTGDSANELVLYEYRAVVLPLSKSAVLVPENSSLIIDVELTLESAGPNCNLQGKLLFKNTEEFCSQKITAEGYEVEILVEWGKPPHDLYE